MIRNTTGMTISSPAGNLDAARREHRAARGPHGGGLGRRGGGQRQYALCLHVRPAGEDCTRRGAPTAAHGARSRIHAANRGMLRRGVSISLRLSSDLTGALVCGLVVFGVAVWLDLGISLERGRDRTLYRRAARVADLLSSSQRDSDAKRERKLEELLEAMPEGRLVQVFDPAGDRIYP